MSPGDAPTVVVVLGRPGAAGTAVVVAPGAATWRRLPAPPAGTAAVAVGAGGQVDALVVHSTRFSDWSLSSAGSWVKGQLLVVPIQFGSSS